MQALLRNVSQRSLEKGSEGRSKRCFYPGDGKWVKPRVLCPQSFPQGQKALAVPQPLLHRRFKEGQYVPQGSQTSPQALSPLPALGLSAVAACRGTRSIERKHQFEHPPAHLQFHRPRGQRQPQSPLNLKNENVKKSWLPSAGPRWPGISEPFRPEDMVLQMHLGFSTNWCPNGSHMLKGFLIFNLSLKQF